MRAAAESARFEKPKIRGTPPTDDQTRPNRYYINLSLYYATLVAVPHPEKGTLKAWDGENMWS